MKIPPSQNRPPATFDNLSAYLPACQQMRSHQYSDRVEWGLIVDGRFKKMRELPQMPQIQAFSSLNDAGLCKLHGEIVPIIAPRQALLGQRPSVDLVPASQQFQWHQWGLIGVVVALATTFLIYSQRQAQKEMKGFFDGQ